MGIAITGEFEPSGGPGSFKLTLADDININGATAAGGGIVDGTDLLICDTGADGTTRSITVSQLPFLLDQTVGIADNNLVEIDSASVADNDYAKFTANGLEGRSYTEVKQDLDLEIGTDIQAWDAQLDSLALLTAAEVGYLDGTIAGTAVALKALVLDSSKNVATIGTLGCGVITQSGTTLDNTYHPVTTVGIANDNLVEIDDADAADNDYAKFTANGLEGRSYSEVKSDLSLSNVENTALSTWAGSSSITTVGTLSAGAVPAQLVTPGTGTFGTGSYTFDTDLTVGGDLTVGVNSLVVDAGLML